MQFCFVLPFNQIKLQWLRETFRKEFNDSEFVKKKKIIMK